MTVDKIVLPLVNGRIRSIPVQDILYFQSDGYLSIVFFEENKSVNSLIVNKRIGALENMFRLEPIKSFRTHRSYLVNAENLKPYGRYPQSDLEFKNGMVAKLSRRKKLDFHNFYTRDILAQVSE